MGTTQGEPTLLTHWSLLGLTQGMTSRGQQDAYFHPPSTSQVATELPVVKTAPAPHLSVHEKLRFPNTPHMPTVFRCCQAQYYPHWPLNR